MKVNTPIGEITADLHTLNQISLAFDFAGNYSKEKKLTLSDRYYDVSLSIYNALDSKEFYKK